MINKYRKKCWGLFTYMSRNKDRLSQREYDEIVFQLNSYMKGSMC